MRAYWIDLRTRVVEARDGRVGTQKEVATRFGVSGTFIKKLLRQEAPAAAARGGQSRSQSARGRASRQA